VNARSRPLVRTVALDQTFELLGSLPDPQGCIWLHRGEGLVAWGRAARLVLDPGPDRFAHAAEWLAGWFDSVVTENEVGGPATGPIAFGSFTFEAGAHGSVLVVPTVVLGLRAGRSFVTTVGEVPLPRLRAEATWPRRSDRVRYAGSSLDELAWLDAVATAIDTVRATKLAKVVLARDLLVWSKHSFDARILGRRLAARYPECFTFSCEGLIGATPELLVRREGKRIESLVLAGSAARGADGADDERLGAGLLSSAKDLAEHELGVGPVRESLSELCSVLEADPAPWLLRLANVQHLATGLRGELVGDQTALELAGHLHPTPAVCGTPRVLALESIGSLEGLDRGRYAGPVGWIDGHGDGEWGIALRCAELAGRRGRLFAGAGIVADSLPEAELEETRLKLKAMQSALEAS
jgi:menaquinone-specific isochorismate synthase